MENPGDDRQQAVYGQGMLMGETPDVPPNFEELERQALEAMSDEAYAYVKGGAGSEDTVSENRRAFRDHRIVPRMLRDVSERDLSVDVLGQTLPAPVVLAPIGVQSIIHENGELATADAAADTGVPMCLSSASSETLEDVSDELGDTRKWFQLYWSSDRDIAASFVERAENADYDALVVTLDTPMMGWRERDVSHGYLPFLDGEGVANYTSDPAFRDLLSQPPEENMDAALSEFLAVFGDATLTWDDLDWLTDQTDLPIVLKGILHPADARRAVGKGAEGIVVSNHGGRQVDNAVAALDALPGVVDAVGEDADVLFDSGIRRGADAVVALALGADAVLLGRPYAYGLALDGAEGVSEVVENFLADLDLTLALTGNTSPADLDRSIFADS
ncbi:alpha-hydroxy-acid oxidizing protein [Salarchaeum sp. JOR-1]|uniref:alpha-hydroxy-acid oxidizing protein n=1 Tax=Salarchaeum sp. JOR-1 TaxID=2599399 RepID=UPI0011985AE6|nr:alpha-hydroxy-acid oxidizing protein [Salarchaeum sp. JOR-1]QDX40937.1 alpha-hydroxy-acid oxidizing protein [Salarchaeum sp. JOR-1]